MQQAARQEPKQGALWFGLVGGALAWTLHLMLSYAVSEWGCAIPGRGAIWLGIRVTCWWLILVSLGTLLGALAAVGVAYYCERQLRERAPGEGLDVETRHPGVYAARAGMVTSGLFAFVILMESVPTFFWFQGC